MYQQINNKMKKTHENQVLATRVTQELVYTNEARKMHKNKVLATRVTQAVLKSARTPMKQGQRSLSKQAWRWLASLINWKIWVVLCRRNGDSRMCCL